MGLVQAREVLGVLRRLARRWVAWRLRRAIGQAIDDQDRCAAAFDLLGYHESRLLLCELRWRLEHLP